MKRLFSKPGRLFLSASIVLVFALLAAGTWQKQNLILSWYYVHRLSGAEPQEVPLWIDRLCQLENSAVPRLLHSLEHCDEKTCANVRNALTAILNGWGAEDSRRHDLAIEIARVFPSSSTAGQESELRLLDPLLPLTSNGISIEIISAAANVIGQATRLPGSDVNHAALELVTTLLQRGYRDTILERSRELIMGCLRDLDPSNRVHAVRLAMRPETRLLESVVPLLGDPNAEVRRCAMLAVGPVPTVIGPDDLLPWMHDSDSEVRLLCEKALRSRGLNEEQLRLGRLLTDGRPGMRLQVIELLSQSHDLEMGVWLRRLSHDPAAAVRAAAIRAAVEQRVARLADRIEQLSQNDPSTTIRQLAHFYLSSNPKSGSPEH